MILKRRRRRRTKTFWKTSSWMRKKNLKILILPRYSCHPHHFFAHLEVSRQHAGQGRGEQRSE